MGVHDPDQRDGPIILGFFWRCRQSSFVESSNRGKFQPTYCIWVGFSFFDAMKVFLGGAVEHLSLGAQKKQLRKQYQAARAVLEREDRAQRDTQIGAAIKALLFQKKIQTVCLYKAFRDEPDLLGLCVEAPELEFALPVVERTLKGSMAFVRFDHNTKMIVNRFGIEEPDKSQGGEVRPHAQTLIILPALAVDRSGVRLGYGGGYYDRYLSCLAPHQRPILLAAVYDPLFVPRLPQEEHDVRVHYVATEKGLFSIAGV